jgi:hypothetical protein
LKILREADNQRQKFPAPSLNPEISHAGVMDNAITSEKVPRLSAIGSAKRALNRMV